MSKSTTNDQGPERPLQGWKEIAAYLERDERTARRWELSDGLPIRRHGRSSRGSVYAYASELETWRTSRHTGNRVSRARRWVPAVAAGLALAAVGWLIVDGPILNPPDSMAEAAEESLRTELIWEAKGISPQTSVSRDGKLMTYVDWSRTGLGNLAVRNLETGESRMLTRDADNGAHHTSNSRISPDGTTVAYSWFRPSPAGGEYELRLLPLDGAETEPRIIFSPTDGIWAEVQDWFPDGEELALTLRESPQSWRLATVSIADGEIHPVRSVEWSPVPSGVRVSPDGRYIAYSRWPSRDAGQNDIFLTAADGSSEVSLVEHDANDELVGWSPDGKYLLFKSDRSGQPGLWTQRVDGGMAAGEPFLVMKSYDAGASGVTRDGVLYYPVRVTKRRLKIAGIDLETGRITEQPADAVERRLGSNYSAEFSPDGQKLVYASGGNGYEHSALVVRSLGTGEEKDLPYDGGTISWQADSRWIRVTGSREAYRIDTVTGKTEPLLSGAAQVSMLSTSWAPDGSRVYYRDLDQGRSHLFAYNLKDGSQVEVADSLAGFRYGLSPDGQRFASIRDDKEILLRTGPDGEDRVLWDPEDGGQLGRWVVWTADGKKLLVLRQKADEQKGELWTLWIVPVDGSDPVETGLSYEPSNAGARPLTIRPDGKQIVYEAGGYSWQIWALRNIPFDQWGEQVR